MRRFTLIGEKTMDFVEIGTDAEAELFEEFFREAHPESGLASYWLAAITEPLIRTDEEKERVRALLTEFNDWREKS